MAGNHNGHPILRWQCFDQFPHFLNTCRVKTISRFIQNKQFRTASQCHRNSKPLLHSKWIVFDLLIHLFFHTDNMNCLLDIFPGQAQQPAYYFHIFPASQMTIIGRGFNQGANAFQNLLPVFLVEWLSHNLNTSFAGLDKTKQHLHCCRFARTIRTEKAINIPFVNLDIQIINPINTVILFWQIFCWYNHFLSAPFLSWLHHIPSTLRYVGVNLDFTLILKPQFVP